MGKSIVVAGQTINLIDAPTTGDVVITDDGVATIQDGVITEAMLATALKNYLYPVAVIGQAKIGFCTIG
jgi:hypothetical protein